MTRRHIDRHIRAVADTIGHFMRVAGGRWRTAILVAASLPVLAAAAPMSKDASPESIVPTQCEVPDDTAMVEGPLPRLARKMKSTDPLTIVVIGSGSAAGSGTSRKDAAFPYRLETRFQKAFNKPKTRLVVLAEMGQTAPSMYARIAKDIIPLKPALVVWQTGSADAARGTPVMEFGMALERGIGELRDQGSDVLLMDSQFSPRASLLVNTDAYREAVRWNARRYDVPLLKRYDTMQYWWSHDVFDLDAEGKANQLDNADHIHDCVAALLVRVIQRGIVVGGKS
ncbi:MAG: SGNH/GDSL hydrolase family protein [Burkholderiaceae bacterium]